MTMFVLLPTENWPSDQGLVRGSGVVANDLDGDHVHVYFEGNVHGASNLVTFADRVLHAADRLIERYPTIAQRHVPRDAVRVIGTFDVEDGVVTVHGAEDEVLLARWLAVDVVPPDEYETTSIRHHNRRVVKVLAASDDPADREKARLYDRELRTGVFS